jgi:hypothetical protein
MPSGGARIGSGPQPSANSRAKDRAAKRGLQPIDDGDWLTLPREGRSGNAPAWPLTKPATATDRSRRELVVWRRLWKSPQAVAWELTGVDHLTVAMYVRALVEVEAGGAPTSAAALVRHYASDLGLSAAGMRALHWRVARGSLAVGAREVVDDRAASTAGERVADAKTKYPEGDSRRLSAKERWLAMVQSGAGEADVKGGMS